VSTPIVRVLDATGFRKFTSDPEAVRIVNERQDTASAHSHRICPTMG
jgi:hypothetical protein